MVICGCINDCINENPSLSDEQSTSLLQSTRDCHELSKQTVDLCSSTLSTGRSLVECGENIHKSLIGAATDLDAESFAVIADLIDGDMSHKAMGLAVSLKDKSSECIVLSKQMVDSLETSVKKLPDWFESYIDMKAKESVAEELSADDRELENVADSEKDISDCIDAIENLTLLSAMETGKRAYDEIASKSQHCHKIFNLIKRFATNLSSLTGDFVNLDASSIISKRKDIYTAIGLCSIMKSFAESCLSLMRKVVALFEGATGKLSQLWKALSHAKDVMVESLREVVDARSFCDEARSKVEKLRMLTNGLESKSRGVKKMDKETFLFLKKLYTGEDFNDTLSTARGLDEEVANALYKMKSSANRVKEGYDSLPVMVTKGILEDSEEELNDNEACKLEENQSNIQGLEEATSAVENKKVIEAIKEINGELSKLPSKIDVCEEMIKSCSQYTERSQSTIDVFLGKWTLESAVSNMQQMCKLANLSKMMEKFAIEIQSFLRAMIRLLTAIMARIEAVIDQAQILFDFGNSGGDDDENILETVVDNALDTAGDLVSDGLNNMIGKMLGK
ncbi:hypothetical protein ACHAXS_005554 [Conticribra weissflogii]